MSEAQPSRLQDMVNLVGIEPATLERLEAKIRDALEQAWYDGRTGHPAPSLSRSHGYVISEIKNMFHAAVKREAARVGKADPDPQETL